MDWNNGAPQLGARRDGVHVAAVLEHETPIGELFKRLGADTGILIRAEAALAKAEVRETATQLGRDAARLGVAVGLAFVGVLALTAFVVIGLGVLLGGNYWLSSLIVGAVAAGTGMMLAKSAINDAKARGVMPTQTLKTLKEDKEWAARQARELKQDLTADPTVPSTRR